MVSGKRFKLKTHITYAAAAISISLFGFNSAFARITVNNSTIYAAPGVIEDTGSANNTSAVNITNNGKFIAEGTLTLSTQGKNSNGITIGATGGSATITSGALSINTFGDSANGVSVLKDGAATISNGTIVTQGYLSNGLRAANAGSITGDRLNIETNGDQTYGASALSAGTISLKHSVIHTFGDIAYGLSAASGGVIDADDIQINTTGFNTHGIFAQGNDSHIGLNNSTINTMGNYSHGLSSITAASLLADRVDIMTRGDSAYGIYTDQGGKAVFTNGSIKTNGVTSYGARTNSMESTLSLGNVYIETLGQLSAGVKSVGAIAEVYSSDIFTYGDGSYGLNADQSGSLVNAHNVNIQTSGNITSSGDTASAVVAEFGGTVNLLGHNTIQTYGTNGIGLLAQVSGVNLPDTVINAGDGTNLLIINTMGTNAYGIEACSLHGDSLSCSNSLQDDLGSADLSATSKAIINVNRTHITTAGQNAYALYTISPESSIVGHSVTGTTSGESAHAITMLRGGEVTLTDSQLQAQGYQADGARIAGGLINDSTAKLALNNSTLISDMGNGISVEPGNSDILLDHSQLKGKERALFTAAGGNTRLSAINGSAIHNNLDASGSLTVNMDNSLLAGDVISRLGHINADALLLSADNGSAIVGGMDNVSTLSLNNSRWDMTKSSDITGLINQQLGGLRLNNGHVNFVASGANYKTLTTHLLSGDGTFMMNTELNDGGVNTHSDLLHITQNASGNHNLIVNNTTGSGALTVGDGIKLVQIEGSSDASFKLGNTVSVGAYQYLLYHGGESAADDWYLRSYLQGTTPQPEPNNVVAYRPEIAGYVAMPYMNQQYGFDAIGTYHERVGDTVIRSGSESWARMGGQHRTHDAERFSYTSDGWFVQFGSDLYQAKTDAGTDVNAGIMAMLGSQHIDTQDRARSLNPTLSINTGKVVSDAYSLGGYYSRLAQDGGYLDLVGQGTFYRNKYQSSHEASQSGFGTVLSAEVGQPYALGANFKLEPQAQIMYQFLSLDNFNDRISNVDGVSSHTGLTRGGIRLSYDKATIKPYILADVVQRIGGNTSVNVGGADISADFTDSWWQTGAGISVQLAEDTQIYTDAKYQRGFDGAMQGYSGRLGIKVSF